MSYTRLKPKSEPLLNGYSIKFFRIVNGVTQESKVEFLVDHKERNSELEREIVWRGIKLVEEVENMV